jgi:hypothetical protein
MIYSCFAILFPKKKKELADKGWVYELLTSDSQTIKQWVTDP